MLDDDDATLWYSDATLPQWIRLELPGVACVSAIRFGGGTAPVKNWLLASAAGTTVATGTNTDTAAGSWGHEVTFAWACDSAFEFRMADAHAADERLGLARLQVFGERQGPTGSYLQTLNGGVAGTAREAQTSATVADCVAACDARAWCKAFNYRKPDAACDLLDVAAQDVGGLRLDWPQDAYDYYERPDLLYEDLCDIPQTCDPGASHAPWDCPQELVPGVHFKAPAVTLGEVVVPVAFRGDTIEAQWQGHGVTCGLLWYAWGWGTSAGGFEASSGGALRGPTAEGSTHDWFTAFPGQLLFLTRPIVNPQDGQQFYVTVEVTNRDGRRAVADADACCQDPAAAGVADGSAAHAACCAAAAGTTARQLVTSPMVVYDSSPPVCAYPPCLRVGGMVPRGGMQRTYHAVPRFHDPCPALVVRPLTEVCHPTPSACLMPGRVPQPLYPCVPMPHRHGLCLVDNIFLGFALKKHFAPNS